VVDSVLKNGFGWEKKKFVDRKIWFMETFWVIYRKHQVDFKWIKGHNNHQWTLWWTLLWLFKAFLVNRCFYEKEEGKVLIILWVWTLAIL
jgi:ribonuclease HI